MEQALKQLGKRYLSQLQVLESRGLLLSLGEEGVNAHRLPAFKLTAQAPRTKCVPFRNRCGQHAHEKERCCAHTTLYVVLGTAGVRRQGICRFPVS